MFGLRGATRRIVATLVAISTSASCTQYSRIPPSEYDSLEETSHRDFRVVMTDERVYMVGSLTVRDGMLVVSELMPEQGGEAPTVPFSVRLADVQHVERIEKEIAVPLVLGVGVVAALIWIGSLTFGPIRT